MNVADNASKCNGKQQDDITYHFNYKISSRIVFMILFTVIMILGILGNLIVCVVVYRTLALRRVITNRFIASLAISDLMVAVFLVPVKIASALHDGKLYENNVLCHYYVTLDNISFVASITNLLVITADRVIAITKPYMYKKVVTHRRARVVILFVWAYAITIGALTNVSWEDGLAGERGRKVCWQKNRVYITLLFVAVFFLPLLTMGIAQVKMACVAMKHSKSIALESKLKASFNMAKRNENETASLNHKEQIILRVKRVVKEYRPVKVVLVVYGTFVAC
eukprot:gene16157-17780_t